MSADFVTYDLGQVNAGATVAVTLRQRANVRLLDAHNFARYRRDEALRAIGGGSNLTRSARCTSEPRVLGAAGGGASSAK